MNRWMKICLIAGGICVIAGGVVTGAGVAMGAGPDLMFRHNSYPIPQGIVKDIIDDNINGAMDDVRDSMQDVYDDMHDMDEDLRGMGRGQLWDDTDQSDSSQPDDWYANFDQLDTSYTGAHQMAYAASSVRELSVELRCGRAILSEADGISEIIVSSDDDITRWSSSMDGDTLKVWSKSGSWQDDDQISPVVYIRVPKGQRFSKVDVETKASTRSGHYRNAVPEFYAFSLTADEVELESKVGAIAVRNGAAGSLDISTDVGAIFYQGKASGEVDAETSVGSIQMILGEKQTDFNYEIKCSLGAVDLGGDSYAGLSGKKVIDHQAARKMELDCNVGAIEVQFDGES